MVLSKFRPRTRNLNALRHEALLGLHAPLVPLGPAVALTGALSYKNSPIPENERSEKEALASLYHGKSERCNAIP